MTNQSENGSVRKTQRLLHEISESLDIHPADVATVEGQHMTRRGNLVYPVRFRGKKVFVTVPEREDD